MTIHVGLIGGGNISATHGRAANAIPGVRVAAIYGCNQEKVARLSQEFTAKAYAGFEASSIIARWIWSQSAVPADCTEPKASRRLNMDCMF